ncbi:MAG TPA: GIY-YIG nuclease family protein [Anaerolineales bacterium]|nr:GIY-YIG nuclease family protein [Anaerolineales bacterium]
MKHYYIYILANKTGTIYTGVTNNLQLRVYQHKAKLVEGFTKKYNVNRLIYYEETNDVQVALAREKEIKSWRRRKKLDLVRTLNPKFEDLSAGWFEDIERQGE